MKAPAITRERAERIARAHACENCGEYSYKRLVVKPDSDAHRKEFNEAWHATIEPGATEPFFLRLFVGGLASRETLLEHVEQFRRDTEDRLAELRAIEPTNTRRGHDYYHWFLLRLGIERRELDLRWADEVLAELRRET